MDKNEGRAFGRAAGEAVARRWSESSEDVSRNWYAGRILLRVVALGALFASACAPIGATPRPGAAAGRDRFVVVFKSSDDDPSLVDWSLNVEPSGVLTGSLHSQMIVRDEAIDRFCHRPPRSGDVMTLELSVQHDDQVSVKRLAEAIERIIKCAERSLGPQYSLTIYVVSPTMTEARELTGSYPDGTFRLGKDCATPLPVTNKIASRPATTPTSMPETDLPPLEPHPVLPPSPGP
jgi:hypothetical protein